MRLLTDLPILKLVSWLQRHTEVMCVSLFMWERRGAGLFDPVAFMLSCVAKYASFKPNFIEEFHFPDFTRYVWKKVMGGQITCRDVLLKTPLTIAKFCERHPGFKLAVAEVSCLGERFYIAFDRKGYVYDPFGIPKMVDICLSRVTCVSESR